MIKGDFEESVILVFWVVAIFISLILGMRNDGQKQQQGGVPRSNRTNGFIPSSFKAISSYLKIVSSGASTVARSAASVASSIVDRDEDANHDQVIWAGFDKLEEGHGVIRQVLLLGYRSGFQVWDVEDANNVRDIVSRHDGLVSFMQMLPKSITLNKVGDKLANKLADCHPLLVVCADASLSGGDNIQDGLATPGMSTSNCHDQVNGNFLPTVVRFYSLRSQSYVHVLKFRSVVYSVRCSSRVVAVSQATQIHCFDAATLEREYTILMNPICPGSGGIGYGPLAVGPRWIAYSGTPVVVSNSGRVSPQHVTPSASFPGFSSNGSLVTHYAKESSKQLAAGIATLGDMGYKKLSRYCSELLPDTNNSLQSNPGLRVNGTVNGHSTDADNVGMVIVKDIDSKVVIAQFRAHRICWGSDDGSSYVHLYRLQRGFTNAVIQDISFSDDSSWIMISSSRGTSHLFAINPWGGAVDIQCADASFTAKNNEMGAMTKPAVRWPPSSGLHMPNPQSLCAAGPPITLSVVSRIRNGSNGWRGTVSGAAAAATGRMSSLSGAIAASFCNCKGNAFCIESSSSKTKSHLLVFSPTGCMMQYALRISTGLDSAVDSGLTNAYQSAPEGDARLLIEAIQKWNICQRHSRREREDNIDIYEAELQMHQARMPLWVKPEIYFHSMAKEAVEMDEETASGGEIEIERIPTRMVEARSKNLIPVFDNLQTPKFHQTRIPNLDSDINQQLLRQSSGLTENGRFSPRNSSSSSDCMTNSVAAVPDLHGGTDGTRVGWSSVAYRNQGLCK
ncbi:Autophagy-related protein like [Quillaja saponaria]|uniref:Autophagy-related protein like n=1 Tax=Quillaja saponaria TaxID=32244 RepID=A0AAD7QHJ2_QUISA|nr:Autophagy-related protein like [Quillaja saponaria]